MSHAPLAVTIPLAAVLLLLAIPAGMTGLLGRAGRLKRRGRLGLHTPAAQDNDASFEAANHVAAPLVLGAAAVGAVCAVLVLAVPVGLIAAIVIFVLGVVGVLGQFLAGASVAERVARTMPRPARKPEGAGCCGACGCGDGGCRSASGDEATSRAAAGVGARTRAAAAGAEIPDLVGDATTRAALAAHAAALDYQR